MLGGSVEVGEKQTSILFEGQTEFGMPRDAKISLALNEPKQVALYSNLKDYLQACTTNRKKLFLLYAKKKPRKNHMGPTPHERSH